MVWLSWPLGAARIEQSSMSAMIVSSQDQAFGLTGPAMRFVRDLNPRLVKPW
jgi:hypothetical protein